MALNIYNRQFSNCYWQLAMTKDVSHIQNQIKTHCGWISMAVNKAMNLIKFYQSDLTTSSLFKFGCWLRRYEICNWKFAIYNWQLSIGNLQFAICNLQVAICNLKLAIWNWQFEIGNLELAIRNWQFTIDNLLFAIGNWQWQRTWATFRIR